MMTTVIVQQSLNIGHGLCEATHSTSYGPTNQYGVDTLYDNGCQAPRPGICLTLYFRLNSTSWNKFFPPYFAQITKKYNIGANDVHAAQKNVI